MGTGNISLLKLYDLLLYFFDNNRTLVLQDYLFVLNFRQNLISVSSLFEQGLIVEFHSFITIKSLSSVICSGEMLNDLYFLSPISYNINNIEIVDDDHNHHAKKRKVSNETYLWHLRLGHINPNRIHGLVKSGILSTLVFEPIQVCESYLEGKMTKRPFKVKGHRATNCWNWCILMCADQKMFKPEEGMSILLPSQMTTQDMNMFT